MRAFLLISLLMVSHLVCGQTNQFGQIESQIQSHIHKNQWDEIILLASDLIIEDPSKGEGYYYTALAFFEIGSDNKAQEYILKAENLADKDLKIKIEDLKLAIKKGKQSKEVLAEIKTNGKEPQAEDWQKLWVLEKGNVEYALNAVENYIEQKKYTKALEILRDPALSKDPEAEKLIKVLNQTPEMKTLNGYNQAMQLGKSSLEDRYYQRAINYFGEALKFKPNNSEAEELKGKAEDELAWENTLDKNTISAYEAYNAGSTRRAHQDEAHQRIQSGLIYLGEKYAQENNVSEMEIHLNKYLSTYPNGKDSGKAKQLMCDVYFKNAEQQSQTKQSYNQDEAVNFYQKASRVCSDKNDLNSKIKKSQRLSIRYGRPNRFFYVYLYDDLCPLGASFGTTNNTTLGAFVTTRFSFASGYGANGTVNNAGTVTGGQYVNWGNDWRFKNEVLKETFGEGLIGTTKKLVYPFWIYLGAGIAYEEVYWKMDIYDNLGKYQDTDWVKNSDESKVKPVIESGLMIDLEGFHLRGGIKTYDFSSMNYSLGIGFSLKD